MGDNRSATHPSEKYVLLTAARNEEKYIARAIETVASQTILPERWVIVSDSSTDKTDEIIQEYRGRISWLTYRRRDKSDAKTDFASKVHALTLGYEELRTGSYSFLGILDADVTLEPTYYEQILSRFHRNLRLGISGGYVYEMQNGRFQNRFTNTPDSVAGAIQLFRRECYEAVGGHKPLRFGGEDTISEVIARMKGWEVCSFPDLKVFHHNQGAGKRGHIRNAIRQGKMDGSMGTDPIYEIVRCTRRMAVRPYLWSGMFRLCGYLLSHGSRENRMVSEDIVKFLRSEQRRKLGRALLGKRTTNQSWT